MLRYIALALMLSPGIAHAQKFVSVGDDTAVPIVAPSLSDGLTVISGGSSTSTGDGSSSGSVSISVNDDVAQIDFSTFGSSVVFDGATFEEIQALLQGASANAIAADDANTIVTRVQTDADGGSILTLDIAGSDGTGSQQSDSGEVDLADFELGECNEGTDWISDNINCHNAYPTDIE